MVQASTWLISNELRFESVWIGLKSSMGLQFSLDGKLDPIACLMFYLVIKIEAPNIFAKKHIKHSQQQ